MSNKLTPIQDLSWNEVIQEILDLDRQEYLNDCEVQERLKALKDELAERKREREALELHLSEVRERLGLADTGDAPFYVEADLTAIF